MTFHICPFIAERWTDGIDKMFTDIQGARHIHALKGELKVQREVGRPEHYNVILTEEICCDTENDRATVHATLFPSLKKEEVVSCIDLVIQNLYKHSTEFFKINEGNGFPFLNIHEPIAYNEVYTTENKDIYLDIKMDQQRMPSSGDGPDFEMVITFRNIRHTVLGVQR